MGKLYLSIDPHQQFFYFKISYFIIFPSKHLWKEKKKRKNNFNLKYTLRKHIYLFDHFFPTPLIPKQSKIRLKMEKWNKPIAVAYKNKNKKKQNQNQKKKRSQTRRNNRNDKWHGLKSPLTSPLRQCIKVTK